MTSAAVLTRKTRVEGLLQAKDDLAKYLSEVTESAFDEMHSDAENTIWDSKKGCAISE